jgi:hypothetical protein
MSLPRDNKEIGMCLCTSKMIVGEFTMRGERRRRVNEADRTYRVPKTPSYQGKCGSRAS